MHKYKLKSKKGEGTFSEVIQAENTKTGEMCAIKCMKNTFSSIEKVNNLREIQAIRRLSPHEHIVKMIEVLYDRPSGRLALVFELMGKNAYELIKGKRHALKESHVKKVIYQVLKAVAHMHKNGIFHRDIKPENILVDDKIVKLADFGSCRGIRSTLPFTEYISTRWYRAPECLLTDGYYGYEMDLWGIGCVLFEILALFPLFPGENEKDQIDKIHKVLGTPCQSVLSRFKKLSRRSRFHFQQRTGSGLEKLIPCGSPQVIDLLYKLLQYHPDDRIKASDALEHPWFQDLREKEKEKEREKDKLETKRKEALAASSPTKRSTEASNKINQSTHTSLNPVSTVHEHIRTVDETHPSPKLHKQTPPKEFSSNEQNRHKDLNSKSKDKPHHKETYLGAGGSVSVVSSSNAEGRTSMNILKNSALQNHRTPRTLQDSSSSTIEEELPTTNTRKNTGSDNPNSSTSNEHLNAGGKKILPSISETRKSQDVKNQASPHGSVNSHEKTNRSSKDTPHYGSTFDKYIYGSKEKFSFKESENRKGSIPTNPGGQSHHYTSQRDYENSKVDTPKDKRTHHQNFVSPSDQNKSQSDNMPTPQSNSYSHRNTKHDRSKHRVPEVLEETINISPTDVTKFNKIDGEPFSPRRDHDGRQRHHKISKDNNSQQSRYSSKSKERMNVKRQSEKQTTKKKHQPSQKLHALGHIPSYLSRHVVKDSASRKSQLSIQDQSSRGSRQPSVADAYVYGNRGQPHGKDRNQMSHWKTPQIHAPVQNVRKAHKNSPGLLWTNNLAKHAHPAASFFSNSPSNSVHKAPMGALQNMTSYRGQNAMLGPVIVPAKNTVKYPSKELALKRKSSGAQASPKFSVTGIGNNPSVTTTKKNSRKRR